MQNRKDFTSGFSPLLSRVISSKAPMRFITLKSGITKRGEQTVTLNAKSYLNKVTWGIYIASCALILTSLSSLSLDAYAERAVLKKSFRIAKQSRHMNGRFCGRLPNAFKGSLREGV